MQRSSAVKFQKLKHAVLSMFPALPCKWSTIQQSCFAKLTMWRSGNNFFAALCCMSKLKMLISVQIHVKPRWNEKEIKQSKVQAPFHLLSELKLLYLKTTSGKRDKCYNDQICTTCRKLSNRLNESGLAIGNNCGAKLSTIGFDSQE